MNADDCIFKSQMGLPVGIDLGKCAEFLTEKLNIITMVPRRNYETMLYYNDGVYINGGYDIVYSMLEREFGTKKNYEGKELLNSHRRKEIIDKVVGRTLRERYVQLSPTRIPTFDRDLDIINMCNGLYNWRTGEFRPHSPSYLSRIQVSTEYNPNANCTTITEIIKDVLKPSDVVRFYESYAYNFYRNYIMQNFFILLGEAGTGKSVLLDMINNGVGEWNKAGVTFQDLGGRNANRFAMARLYNKLVNIAGDLDSTYVPEVGKIKMLTSGIDGLEAERKFEHEFQFVNFAKTWYSANQLPIVNELSDGFYRRALIFLCDTKFSIGGDLSYRLAALNDPVEISGLFNTAMEYLPDLLERRRFTNQPSIDETKALYRRSSNTVEEFIVACVTECNGEFISKEDFYKCYLKYCKKFHLAHINNKVAFGRMLKKVGFEHEAKIKNYKGNNVQCWTDCRVCLEP